MKVDSSAFPSELSPTINSRFHKMLADNYVVVSPIGIREFTKQDLNDLVQLQLEWFPLKYGKSFYDRILNNQAKCLLAVTQIKINEEVKEVIVGAIVYERSDSRGYLAKDSYWQYLYKHINTIYIMTLGVINQFRNRGIAQMLINKLMSISLQDNQIKMILLHVVSYNQSAIRFYQKNKFLNLQNLKQFYHINNKDYDGYAYGLYINNGKPSLTWKNWFKQKINIL